MYRHLYLVFGTLDEHESWLVGIGDEPLPAVGEVVRLSLPRLDGSVIPISAHVRYRTWVPGEPLRVYAHGGAVVPPREVRELLTTRGCVRLSSEESEHIVATILNVPTLASIHEVLLIVGSEDIYEAWRWVGAMEDRVIPIFGQRVHLPLLEMSKTPWSDVLASTPPGIHRSVHMPKGVVFYAAKSESGDAQIAVSIKSVDLPQEMNGFDLLAGGWEKLSREHFSAEQFDTWARINLAERTILFSVETENGKRGIDFEVVTPETISSYELDLLPLAIRNYCLMFWHSRGITPENI